MSYQKNIFKVLIREELSKEDPKGTSNFKDIFSNQKFPRTLINTKDLIGHEGCVNALSFSDNGNLLVTGSDDATVKLWDSYKGTCIKTLRGHISNVFATLFLNCDERVVSGGNEGDARYYDIERNICSVYRHHVGKVLQLATNTVFSDCWFSCSSDSTVRMFDVRQKYSKTETLNIDNCISMHNDNIVPQAYGGGRIDQRNEDVGSLTESLILNYKQMRPFITLFDVCFHPKDPFKFVVASSAGDVRMFDLRMIREYDPSSHINIYRSDLHEDEITGCGFSTDGNEIITSRIDNDLYLYDTNMNFEALGKMGYISDTNRFDDILEDIGTSYDACARVIASFIVDHSFLGIQSNRNVNETINSDDMSLFDLSSDDEDTLELPKTYKARYTGHTNKRTLKGCSFWGPNSEYIISGSDDKLVYIWNKLTRMIEAKLSGHDRIVNFVAGHPNLPIIATSGLDHVVKIWEPRGECCI